MVESVNGTPKRSAARAARISPSAQFKPVRPVGASATGMRASWPTMVTLVERRSTSMPTRWRSASDSRSARFARSVHFAVGAAVDVIEDRARDALFRQLAQVFDAGHHRHGSGFYSL